MRVRSVGVVLVALLLPACEPEPQPVGPLVPALRVIDALRPPRAGIVQGGDLQLGPLILRTVMLPATFRAFAELDAAGQRYRVAELPAEAEGWTRARAVRRAVLPNGIRTLAPETVDFRRGPPAVRVATREQTKPYLPVAFHAMTARLPSVDTTPFTVPPGAVLRFDVGVHALMARPPLPIGARVSVVDGSTARTLWRGRLSSSDDTWHEASASLAAHAGRRVRLRFTTRPGRHADIFGMLGVFGEPVVLAPRPAPVAPFNVVLVSMDTLRARSLGAYGSARPTSPTLDALAADGALFENAFSAAAFTLPGHMSMLSGLWFRTHEALLLMSSLSHEHRMLAEVLQDAGYATGAFTSGAWIVPWAGFRRGFEAYCDGNVRAEKRPPYDSFARGLQWIRANADRPFFAFVHNFTVHAPYAPPPPYDRMFEALPEGAPEMDRKLLAYEQEVRWADDQLRGFLEGLDAIGVADRTLVIVTADHGEQFGEHGSVEHTYSVYDEVVRVPLVMRLPGAIRAGTRLDEPVSLVDLAPTVLELIGLPPLHGADGTSLLPLVTGEATRLPREGVFSEAVSEPHLGWVDLVAVHTRTTSCIRNARLDTHECWDRRRDPWQELSPLPAADVSSEVIAAKALLARYEATKPPPGTPRDPKGAEPSAPPETAPAAVRAERREQLRALGYVE